jgi:hypothetical protein
MLADLHMPIDDGIMKRRVPIHPTSIHIGMVFEEEFRHLQVTIVAGLMEGCPT